MVAQLARSFLEQVGRVGMLERRRGIFVRTWRLKNVSAVDQLAAQIAGLAANAHHLFGVPIVRLQLIVRYAPVLHSQIRRQARGAMLFGQMRSQREDVRKKSEAHAGPTLPRSPPAGSRMERAVLADGHRGIARGVAMRDGLFG